MKRSDLFQIPEKALKNLCAAYDKEAGEYTDPRYIGKEIYEFYRSEMAILTKDRIGWDKGLLEEQDTLKKKEAELIERLAELEHKQWIAWSKLITYTENISKDRFDRWRRLWCPYSELTGVMKDQDRKWARKVVAIIKEKNER